MNINNGDRTANPYTLKWPKWPCLFNLSTHHFSRYFPVPTSFFSPGCLPLLSPSSSSPHLLNSLRFYQPPQPFRLSQRWEGDHQFEFSSSAERGTFASFDLEAIGNGKRNSNYLVDNTEFDQVEMLYKANLSSPIIVIQHNKC
nr:uncharacterized protein LOC103456112 [Malus domestica]